MPSRSQKFMRGGNKVPIKKTVTKKGKSYQQTFWVSPQEAVAMKKKALAKAQGPKKRRPQKLVTKADKTFDDQRWKSVEKKWKGRLPEPPSFGEHKVRAQKALSLHAKGLNKKLSSLESLSPKGSKVKGRVKTVESAIGKVGRKPKYGTPDKLQDLTGTRVIAKNSADVMETVANIKRTYTVIEEDDYITSNKNRFPDDPKKQAKLDAVMDAGYRSYHMIAQDKDGSVFEIQVRTPNQNTWADWFHDVYKPMTDAQRSFLRDPEKKRVITEYGRAMGAHYELLDTGKPSKEPPCPSVVKSAPFGGCMGRKG